MKILILTYLFILPLAISGNTVLGQSNEKTYTSSNFGWSMKYPSDWTFVPEEEHFSPGIYDYSVITPPGFASVGRFCLTSGDDAESLDCQTESPVYLGITVFKLENGTTLKEFYEPDIAKMDEQLKGLIGSRKYIDTKQVNISGLSAVETISTSGGASGSLGKLLPEIGKEPPISKHLTVYILNGSTGYQIFGSTKDEEDFDEYLPALQRMIDSFQIEGAQKNQDNTGFVPETNPVPTEDVVLLSHRLKEGGGDYNDVIGQVKNIGTDTVEFVKIGLTVYDRNGDVIGTDSTYSDATTLKPNQKSSFDILSNKDNFDGMESYDLSLQWQSSDGTEEYVDNAQIYKVNETNTIN